MQQKAVFELKDGPVNGLLVEFSAQRYCSERLCFATCKNGRAVRAGQVTYFAPDRANVGAFAPVQTNFFIKGNIANRIVLHVVVIFLDEGGFFIALLFAEGI